MFCSRCGKTIPQGVNACAHCGMEIAPGEFSAESYISSQPKLHQSEAKPVIQPRYTRTTYTTMQNENDGDILRRTAYRPAFQEEAPEIEPEEAPAQPETEEIVEEEPAPLGDPSALPDNMRFRPFTPLKSAGISPRMAERMRKAEEEAAAAAAAEAEAGEEGEKKPARPVVSGLFSAIGRGAKTLVPKREVFSEETQEEVYEDEVYDDDETPYDEEDEVFDVSDIEEEDEAPERPRLFSFKNTERAPVSRGTKIVRGVVAAVCIIALLLGGFIWLSLETAAKSPIGGVTYTLYEQAIALLESHTTKTYREEMSALYAQDPTGALILTEQMTDQAELLALLPGTLLANDQDFMDTVMAIQSNIDIAVTLDGLDSLSGTANSGASTQRWNAVQNAIRRLRSAKSVTEFSAITQAAEVTATPTPAPTPTVSPYSTLTKGMKDDPAVKAMQNRLYELGWFTDVRDGDFGSQTQTSIKMFQQASGMTVTGIADPETLEAIYAEDALRTGTRITPAPTPGDGSVTGEAIETPAPVAPAPAQ